MAIENIGASTLASLRPGSADTQSGALTGQEKSAEVGTGFANELSRFIEGVNRDQVEAAGKIKDLAVEGKGSIHDTMVAVSNAEGSFRLLMEMRNRMIDGVNRLLQSSN